MNILHYEDLDTRQVKKQFKKVEGFLKVGDFKSAEVKKMQDGFYRAKLDRENRLLFRFAEFAGEKYLLLLEVILNHEYEKSRFLNGAVVDESKYELQSASEVEQEDVLPLNYVNPRLQQFHILDKIISFDDEQYQIYGLPAPLVIIGSAGSGKTALTLEKMKHFRGKVLYLSLSPYLVENAQRIYYSHSYDNEGQEVDFLSFNEFLESIAMPKGREIAFRDFEAWYSRYQQAFKFKEPYKLFEEFKGVLTGSVVDKPYLSREDYLGLGVKQSIFLKGERERVYDLFEKYLGFLSESPYFDSNILSHEYLRRVESSYHFVVVDEVQDLTNVQLSLVLKSLEIPTQFLLSGDSNQIVHPNFFSWSKIKSLFFHQDLKGSALRILKTNYRNSRQVTRVSNELLKIKNARFGSIDKESTYLIQTVSDKDGEINFFEDNDKIKKELDQKTRSSTKFAVLVMDNQDKPEVRRFFNTPLVFSIHEAKGLEYENIILYNFISSHQSEFREITRDVSKEDIQDENLSYRRAKDKSDKDLEAYKFYINSLYVAFTRAVKNLYIIEKSRKHDILGLLDIVETQKKLQLQTQASDDTEWLEEARRLEMQGKVEQAMEIRARLSGQQYISPEMAAQLEREIFEEGNHDPDKCKQLMTYAKSRQLIAIVQRLYHLVGFGPAKQFLGEFAKAQKILSKHCQNGNIKQVHRIVEKFGVDIPDEKGMTGLMHAVLYNKEEMMAYFAKHEASTQVQDLRGRSVAQMALLAFEREQISKKQMQALYLKYRTPSIKCLSDGKMQKINFKSMEYFLLQYLHAVRDEIIDPNDPPARQGLNMDEFMEYIELMPDKILAPYRKKRQYVNSILAKNEVDREDRYNRKLFRRKSRGVYNLLEDLEVSYE